jgi:hypothetical protein
MELQKLTEEFRPARWIEGPFKDIPGDGWFLLEINPVPPRDEIAKVVSDIDNNKLVRVGYETGRIYHSLQCDSSDHPLSPELEKALEYIKDETYLVVVLPQGPIRLSKQPVAIALKPDINYFIYPDHPHLNEDGHYDWKFYFPHSFCYKHDHMSFQGDLYDRVLDAFEQISIWLFRHQVWLATRESGAKGIWIGKGQPPLPNGLFPRFLNPDNRCRCGNNRKYIDCHMKQDFIESIPFLNGNKFFDKDLLIKNRVPFQKELYENSLKKNQDSMKKLNQALLK